MTLRNQIIRLAHSKPELRDTLLPLLKKARSGQHAASPHLLKAMKRIRGIKDVWETRRWHEFRTSDNHWGYEFDISLEILETASVQRNRRSPMETGATKLSLDQRKLMSEVQKAVRRVFPDASDFFMSHYPERIRNQAYNPEVDIYFETAVAKIQFVVDISSVT